MHCSDDGGGTVVLLVPLDAFEQVGLPKGEKHRRRLPGPDLVQMRPETNTEPRVEVRIAENRIEARIVGDPRPRRLLAMTLGASPLLAEEENDAVDGARAPVEGIARPIGGDAVASFVLAGAAPAAVHIDFEQGLQIGSLGIDPAQFSEVLRPWLVEQADLERESYDLMLARKGCLDGDQIALEGGA